MKKSMGAAGAMALMLVALLVAGCGSGGGGEALSKSEFVKQANNICTKATESREKVLAEFLETANPNGNQEALQKKALAKLLPFYQGAAEQIGDLGAPKGDESKVEAIVSAMKEATAKAEASPQSVAVGNVPFRKANEAVESYGLKACVI